MFKAELFYKSAEWKNARRAALIACNFLCSVCGKSLHGKAASRVDHIKTVRTHPHLRLMLTNLRCLCPSCDNKRHSEKGRGGLETAVIDANGYPPGWA